MKITVGLAAFALGFCVLAVEARPVMAQIPVQNSNAEILGVIAVIDQNDIHMAQLAEQKNIDRRVLNYARMLDRDRNENLDQVRGLSRELGITLVRNSPSIGQLRANGEQDVAILTPLDQDNFSREFISDMIEGHSDVLAWIDSQETQNTEVQRFLDNTRQWIGTHLNKAQIIREQVLK